MSFWSSKGKGFDRDVKTICNKMHKNAYLDQALLCFIEYAYYYRKENASFLVFCMHYDHLGFCMRLLHKSVTFSIPGGRL